MSRGVAVYALWCALAAWVVYRLTSVNPQVVSDPPGEAPRDCIAIGFGSWMPHRPDWLSRSWWYEPPHLRLLLDVQAVIYGDQWFSLGFAPSGDSLLQLTPKSPPARLVDFLWGWRAPTADSLHLIRFAALSVGLSVGGRWQGDTLRGRAHGFSDVFTPNSDPRANAYAIRYRCEAPGADAAASRAIQALVIADRPDVDRSAIEAASESARMDSVLKSLH